LARGAKDNCRQPVDGAVEGNLHQLDEKLYFNVSEAIRQLARVSRSALRAWELLS